MSQDPIVKLWAKTQALNAELELATTRHMALHKVITARRPGQPQGVAWAEWHEADPDLADCEAAGESSNALCSASSDLYDRITIAAAVTPDGIRAKAAAALSIWVQEKAMAEEMWCYDLILNALREAAAGSAV